MQLACQSRAVRGYRFQVANCPQIRQQSRKTAKKRRTRKRQWEGGGLGVGFLLALPLGEAGLVGFGEGEDGKLVELAVAGAEFDEGADDPHGGELGGAAVGAGPLAELQAFAGDLGFVGLVVETYFALF